MFEKRKKKQQKHVCWVFVCECKKIKKMIDFDAIGRLVGNNPFDYSNDQFAVAIPQDKFVPWNSQMTVILREAFVLMYLPVTVHGRVSDIWRSYFAEAIMSQFDMNLLYVYPVVKQIRNAHNYLADFQSEIPLYLRAGRLIDHLHQNVRKTSYFLLSFFFLFFCFFFTCVVNCEIAE